jgi:hypothetical protein
MAMGTTPPRLFLKQQAFFYLAVGYLKQPARRGGTLMNAEIFLT